jgi:hypothetical protein
MSGLSIDNEPPRRMDMTKREPGRDESRDESPATRARTETAAPQQVEQKQAAIPDEEKLFGAGRGPRIFGEGDYASGGTANEGNFEVSDRDPHGSYGSFDDAGGYGGTELLGDETPPAPSAPESQKSDVPKNPGKSGSEA